jgi:hypothetical protein
MDLDSDGSDYEAMDEESSESADVLSSFEPERKVLPIRDVEIPADYCLDPCTISVKELQEIIQGFFKKGTLKKELTQVDTSTNIFTLPEFSAKEIHLGKKDDHYQRAPRVISKTYGTQLHYACRDRNGFRGEQKTRLLLEAAAEAEISFVEMFTVSEVTARFSRGQWRTNNNEPNGVHNIRNVSFFILLDNKNSTISSIRMLAAAWPNVVHFRRFGTDEYHRAAFSAWNWHRQNHECCVINTLFHVLLKNSGESGGSKEQDARAFSIVETLLEFAEKTTQGAEGLVSANMFLETDCPLGSLCSGDHNSDLEKARNGIHIALTNEALQTRLLSLLIKAWPDALKYSDHDLRKGCQYPLHTILDRHSRNTLDFRSKVQATEVLLTYSSIEAVAVALLRTCGQGKLGFHEIMRTLSESSSSAEDKQMKNNFNQVLKTLLRRKDTRGRTLLHYTVEYECKLNCSESLNRRFAGLGFDLGLAVLGQETRDQSDGYETCLEERQQLHRRNKGYQMEVIHWILKEVPSLAFACDINGLNPFHLALKSGKTWEKGLSDLVTVVPEWAYRATKGGLAPFQLAATVVNQQGGELDTIYELLKYTGRAIDMRRNAPLARRTLLV